MGVNAKPKLNGGEMHDKRRGWTQRYLAAIGRALMSPTEGAGKVLVIAGY